MASIAVIDSGIDINFKEFKNKDIKGIDINTYKTSIESIRDYHGHGTACIAEILRINPSAKINSIKLLNENSQASIKKLIESIEYATSIDDVRLISLSCSTFQERYMKDLKKVIDYANEKNKLLICASDNKNILSYPSYMSGVVGIQRSYTNIKNYWFNSNYKIQCICKSKYRLLPQINKNYRLFGGNSYCTAYFCGLVSLLIEDNKQIENEKLLELIESKAERTRWKSDDLKFNHELENEKNNSKYDFFKIRMLVNLIEKFSNIERIQIYKLPIYNMVDLLDIYKLLCYLKNEVNSDIDYTSVTDDDLHSIYSLNNLIFKDEII